MILFAQAIGSSGGPHTNKASFWRRPQVCDLPSIDDAR